MTARRALKPANRTLEYNYEKVQYDEKIIAKAVHIIRNPFDNIVSRYHLFLKTTKNGASTPTELLLNRSKDYFTNDSKGFARWCKRHDEAHTMEEMRHFGEEIYKVLDKVPCRADFYRYIQWHNYAFEVISDMNIPSLIIHYEDFAKDFNRTKDNLFMFIEAEEIFMEKKKKLSFVMGEKYFRYYDKTQQLSVVEALKKLCNEQAMKQILHYYFSKA